MAAAGTFLSRFFLKSQSWQAPRVWQQVTQKTPAAALASSLLYGITGGNTARALSGKAAAGSDVIGIDLGTTNSCVATMEGKVRENLQQYTVR
jgi:hypothetical protein